MKKRSNDIKAESAGNAAGDDDKEEIVAEYIAYCRKILRNKAINLHQKANREERRLQTVEDENLLELQDAIGQEDRYSFGQTILIQSIGRKVTISDERLYHALLSILPRYREILYLSYLLDYNDAEISRILGKPVSTVHSRKKAALRRLRELLGDPYGE